jgi:hypothetical protein
MALLLYPILLASLASPRGRRVQMRARQRRGAVGGDRAKRARQLGTAVSLRPVWMSGTQVSSLTNV